jgi:RsiW-degrading membrane proteinase PrsW (M82 family)
MLSDALLINSLLTTGYLVLVAVVLDRHEREPAGELLRLFWFGILATGAFGFLKCSVLDLCGPHGRPPLFEHYVIAGVLEEALKFGVLLWFVRRCRHVDEPLDAMIYLGIVALAFAFDENIGYFLHYTEPGRRLLQETGVRDDYQAQLRMITFARALPGHLLFDTIAGGLLALGVGRGDLRRYLGPAFAVAVLLHGTWNLLAGSPAFFIYILVLMVAALVTVGWAARQSPHRRRQQELLAAMRRRGLPDDLVGEVRRALRRNDGRRQASMTAAIYDALQQPPADAATLVGDVIAGDREHGRSAARIAALVGGALVTGYVAQFVLLILRVVLP